jgi:hypothetical protein
MQPFDVPISHSGAAAAVTSVNSSRNCLQARHAALLRDPLVKFSGLNHFDISANPGLGGEGVAAILESLAGMQLHARACVAT